MSEEVAFAGKDLKVLVVNIRTIKSIYFFAKLLDFFIDCCQSVMIFRLIYDRIYTLLWENGWFF